MFFLFAFLSTLFLECHPAKAHIDVFYSELVFVRNFVVSGSLTAYRCCSAFLNKSSFGKFSLFMLPFAVIL